MRFNHFLRALCEIGFSRVR